MRILHVVGGMNRGGTETWLLNVLRHIDRSQFHMDFLVHTTEPQAYDDEVRSLGSEIIPCLHPSQPWNYTRNFRKILRDRPAYDVIHSHVHYYSGYVLKLAAQAGIPRRIAHSHTDLKHCASSLPRQLYLWWMGALIRHYATHGIGASQNALRSLFGADWQQDPRWQPVYCGINLKPFQQAFEATALRSRLGIPPDRILFGHVGRFDPAKNHAFLLEIAAEVIRDCPKALFLFVGDGSLRADIQTQMTEKGLNNHVMLTGARSDVADLMRAMDVFVFPSHYEGLGLALLEAQAAGLPCVISDVIPLEADVVLPLIHRVSLSCSAQQWAQTLLAVSDRPAISAESALQHVQQSPFSIQASVDALVAIYRSSRPSSPLGFSKPLQPC